MLIRSSTTLHYSESRVYLFQCKLLIQRFIRQNLGSNLSNYNYKTHLQHDQRVGVWGRSSCPLEESSILIKRYFQGKKVKQKALCKKLRQKHQTILLKQASSTSNWENIRSMATREEINKRRPSIHLYIYQGLPPCECTAVLTEHAYRKSDARSATPPLSGVLRTWENRGRPPRTRCLQVSQQNLQQKLGRSVGAAGRGVVLINNWK